MRKVRLEVEALEVESFVADGAGGERGTVHGAQLSFGCTLSLDSIERCVESGFSCPPSCGANCPPPSGDD